MFYLLVVLIAIALIGLVTATTSSYIGDAFQSGSADAKAVTLINGSSQISSAATLYETQGNGTVSSLGTLTSQNYLSQMPKTPAGGSYNLNGGGDWLEAPNNPSADVCSAVNEKAGASETSALSDAISAASTPDVRFGCDKNGTFFYKL